MHILPLWLAIAGAAGVWRVVRAGAFLLDLLEQLGAVVGTEVTGSLAGNYLPAHEYLHYEEPSFDLRDPNFVIGSYFVGTVPKDPNAPFTADEKNVLGILCQMAKYNINDGLFPMSGTLNMYTYATDAGNYNATYTNVQLLRSNLYLRNGTRMAELPPVGAIVGAGSYPQYAIAAPIYNYFSIPLVGFQFTFDIDYMLVNTIQDQSISIYQVNSAQSFSVPEIVIGVAEAFGWDLTTFIFGSSGFGFVGQTELAQASAKAPHIQSRCSITLFPDLAFSQSALSRAVDCINSTHELNYVILYMEFSSALPVVRALRQLGLRKTAMPIIAVRQTSLQVVDKIIKETNDTDMRYVMFTEVAISENINELVEFCISTTFGATTDPHLRDSLQQAYALDFRCDPAVLAGHDKNPDIPFCPTDRTIPQPSPCYCTGTEMNDYFDYKSKFAFAADSVNLIANGISLLQNNCTALNERYALVPVPSPDFCSLKSFTPAILTQAMNAANFEGYTGPISFNPLAPVRKVGNFQIRQYNENLDPVVIGSFIDNILTVDKSKVAYYGSSFPQSTVLPSYADLTHAVVIVFFAFAILGAAIAVALLVWTIVYRNELRRSSPVFLSLLLTGIILVFVSLILISIGLKSSAMCILSDFFMFVGITLIVSNLMSRNYRVYAIFTNPTASAIHIRDQHLLRINGICMTLTLIQWGVYSFAGGVVTPTVFYGDDNKFYAYTLCESPSSWFQTFRIIAMWVYFVVLVLMVGLLGFLTRKINKLYNESQAVSIIAYMYLMFAIIFAPLYYLVGGSTDGEISRYLDILIPFTISAYTTMVVLFLPKIIGVQKELRRRSERLNAR